MIDPSRDVRLKPGPPTRPEKCVRMTFNMTASLHKYLKLEAALRGCTMTHLIEEALKPYREMYEAVKPPGV